jgi:hypothetical protein
VRRRARRSSGCGWRAGTQRRGSFYLPGNAARALRALGLEHPVADRAAAIPKQRFCDARGRLLLEVDVAALWSNVGLALRSIAQISTA